MIIDWPWTNQRILVKPFKETNQSFEFKCLSNEWKKGGLRPPTCNYRNPHVSTIGVASKTQFLLFFFVLINLHLYYVFQAPPSLWDFFQLRSTCHVHLKIGTCSLNIMLNKNLNFHTPWDSQNPYNLRLNQKHALSAGSKKTKTATFNIIIS
jgi:hypothetical protein